MYLTSNFKVLHLLVVATVVVVVLAASGTSYLNDPLLKKFAAESNGALKPVTNFHGRRNPLTGPQGISLRDFKHAPPRKNGAYLDATLIAMELSTHNWALGHILTATGGVDVDKAKVILSSRSYQDETGDHTVAPILVDVQKQRSGRGNAPWWIEAYDSAITSAIQQKYGVLGRWPDDKAFLELFTGSHGIHLGNSTFARRVWKRRLIEQTAQKVPVVVGTSAPEDYGDGPHPALLKYPHAYAVEGVTRDTTSDYEWEIATITLRDAETATKGVTYKFADVLYQLHDLWWVVDSGPGQNNPEK